MSAQRADAPQEAVAGDGWRTWPAERVSLPGRTLFVRAVPPLPAPAGPGGAAEPAVYVHGLGGSALNWVGLMDLLRDRLDSVAVDLNGFGCSPPPRDGDYSLTGHARAVAELVAHRFGGRRVHLFGNSLGGAVALQLAARRPDLVATLTLVSPALPDLRPMRTNAHLPVVAVPGVGERLVRRYGRLDAQLRAAATIDACFADVSRLPELLRAELEEEVRQRDRLPYVADAMLGSLRGLLASYLDTGPRRPWRLAERVEAPVLFVYGGRDALVSPRAAHRVTRHVRDARVVLVADSGHVTQMEHPDVVAGAWRDLLGAGAPAPRG